MMETVETWARARRIPPSDPLVAVLVLLSTSAGATDHLAHWLPPFSRVLLSVLQAALVLGRRRAPMAVLWGTAAVTVFMIATGFPAGSSIVGLLVATYAVAVRGDPARTTTGAVAAGAATLAVAVATTLPGSRTPGFTPFLLLTVTLAMAVAWVSGYAVRTRRAYIGELKERAARLEREEGERAARAVAEERLRIARELHDVIGHSISLITIQAEAATRSARTNPDAVPGFLATISATSRETLAELRHVLAVLRPQGDEDLSPQPGLEALADLVARIREAGLPVRLDVEPLTLPPGVGLTVYRIVQEALTNVLRHAGPAGAAVTVARAGAALRVSVHDDGRGPAAPPSPAAHGLVGMRERVAAYGGTLYAGRRPEGGFAVDALLPMAEEQP